MNLDYYNALGIGNIINTYDPEMIIVMGPLGLNQFKSIIPTKKQIEKYTIIRPIPSIVKTYHSDDLGLLGAFAYGLDNTEEN